jgi:murein DD-endopeptidase MepM/ murein hydrolase activator NlpD
LIIDHGLHLSSSFLHLNKILVQEGEVVKQGDPIAEIGSTGRVTGPHLDWRMNLGAARIDPQLLVPPMPE